MTAQFPEAAFWLALAYASGLKLARVKAVVTSWCLEKGYSLAALFELDAEELTAQLALSSEERKGVVSAGRRVAEQGAWLSQLESEGVQLITRVDPRYPLSLITGLPAPIQPLLLFCQGEVSLLGRPAAVVIGTRDASTQAVDWARILSSLLAEEGVAVISGFGRGVGQAAFNAALAAEGGHSIAVLPMGIRAFAGVSVPGDEIDTAVQQGQALLLSPFHPSTKFSQTLALARNKLMVALAQAVFVVTAGGEGITRDVAQEALQGGKGVYVWDVDVAVEPAAIGNQDLLQAGGLPITGLPDIVDAVETIVAAALELSEAAHPRPATSPVSTLWVEEPDAPYDSEAVLDLLSESGRVPEILARRLRKG